MPDSDSSDSPLDDQPQDAPEAHDAHDAHESQPTKERRTKEANRASRKRRWGRRLAATALMLAIVVLFAPQIASLGWPKSWIAGRLSKETRLAIQIGSIHVRWWSPLVVRDVQVATPAGEPIGQLERLETGKTLWSLLRAGVDKGELRLVKPQGRLELTPSIRKSLEKAALETRPDRGLLGKILKPHEDTRLKIVVDQGALEVRPEGVKKYEQLVSGCSPVLQFERIEGKETLTIAPGDICRLEISPVLCDWGLDYVLPVLAGAVDADGHAELHLAKCILHLGDIERSEVSGDLHVGAVRAKVEGPVLKAVTEVVVRLADRPEEATVIHLMDDCRVDFALTEGRVSHQGLRFGLPRLLPAVAMETRGSIGLDQTLDLYLETNLPFDKLGDGPLLQKLGSPRVTVPIAGTLAEPKVDLGNGKLAQDLMQELVSSLADGQVDAAPLLEQLGELGLVERIRDLRRGRQEDEQSSDDAAPNGGKPSADDAPPDRPRILERLRKRGGLSRRQETSEK